MRRVAVGAADVIRLVGRAQKVAVLFPVLMAREAALADLRGNYVAERKYLRRIAALGMVFARSVAALAALAHGEFRLGEADLAMRAVLDLSNALGVALFALSGADVAC